jgi:hypothetical protein
MNEQNKKNSNGHFDLRVSLIGTVGAFLLTFAVCYILAMGMFWIAGRLISTGGGGGVFPTAIVALILTIIVYLYDKENTQ